MSIQITDCTIRDGGYLLDKNPSAEYIKGVMKGLAEAGIDFVETGFLQTKATGESLVYRNSHDVIKYLPNNKNKTEFLGFCDNSRYSIEQLDKYDGKSFKWLRISFAKHEAKSALEFCAKAQEKGYIIQFNPMDTVSYSEKEMNELLKDVNNVKPGAVSIVDTFGAMYIDDLIRLFKQFDSILLPEIKIGLHSHDNLGLSTALAEQIIMLSFERNRDVMVDGSLMGMGRGAGNASTELLASFLNKKYGYNYNISILLKTIEKYIMPLKQQIIWGYDLNMFICGSEHAHVDNISYLKKKNNLMVDDIYQIIKQMEPSTRTRYGANYLKSDFSYLQKIYDRYLKGGG